MHSLQLLNYDVPLPLQINHQVITGFLTPTTMSTHLFIPAPISISSISKWTGFWVDSVVLKHQCLMTSTPNYKIKKYLQSRLFSPTKPTAHSRNNFSQTTETQISALLQNTNLFTSIQYHLQLYSLGQRTQNSRFRIVVEVNPGGELNNNFLRISFSRT